MPKPRSANRRKETRPTFEALKTTIEKKKQCTTKALEIVTTFSEKTISESCLLENLQFINQEYYQDIVEERAINELCGYPVCVKSLKNVPTKQYHISTVHNKVFDITDRKNFCSNVCYKASKYLKDQIDTSPLWLREHSSNTLYKLISLQSKGGVSGEEVDLGISTIKVEPDESLADGDHKYLGKSDEKFKQFKGKKYTDFIDNKIDHHPKESLSNKFCLEDDVGGLDAFLNNDSSSSSCIIYGAEHNDSSEPLNLSDSKHQTFLQHHKEDTNEHEKSVSSEKLDSKICQNTNDELGSSDKTLSTGENEEVIVTKTDATETIPILNQTEPVQKTKSRKTCTKRKSNLKSTAQQPESPMQNSIMKTEQILKEWFTIDSALFLFGNEKIKNILAEKKSYISECQSMVKSTENAHFYEQYLAICKKLNILELEDKKIDASVREEIKKPLPNYEALKEEAKNFDLKVKMFYSGDKVVRFEDTAQNSTKTDVEDSVQEPVLPLVDLHAQKLLRRRIVIDKLRRVIVDLQKSLGLKGFDLNQEVRALISTFSLAAHNITMKPAEWNLVAIVIIKLLSIKDVALEQAINSTFTKKHLTLLLMSYSLDGGYLDRLAVWLSDLEHLIEKSEK